VDGSTTDVSSHRRRLSEVPVAVSASAGQTRFRFAAARDALMMPSISASTAASADPSGGTSAALRATDSVFARLW